MARSASVSDNEANGRGTRTPAKDVDMDPESEDAVGEQEEDEQEEEYEIEEILDAQRGQFGEGRWGYFVKWKGYGPEENSWVDEQDAGNAHDLIKAYWNRKKEKEKKAPRKSGEKPAARKPRKSSATETPEPTSVARKRGRKSQVTEIQSDDEEVKNTKKQKKAENRTTSVDSDDIVMVEDQEERVGDMKDMKKYMRRESWEDLVERIDTVEKAEKGNELIVYFRLTAENGGGRIRLNSSICSQKFPQKMLKFYESNLRWKEAEVDVEEMVS